MLKNSILIFTEISNQARKSWLSSFFDFDWSIHAQKLFSYVLSDCSLLC